MTKRFSSNGLRGIIPPVITPLFADGSIDTESLVSHLDRLVCGGVHGVFLLGTTGEGPSLSYRKRQQLIEAASEALDDRVPLLVSVTDTSIEEAIDLADFCLDAKVSALVAAPPYYLPIDQLALHRYYLMLAESVRLPLVLYNMPSCTKVALESKLVLDLASHENIIGMKDSSGDMSYFRRMISMLEGKDFPLMIGPEHMLWTALRAGGTGGVCGGANLWPKLHSTLIVAHEQGNRNLAVACDAMIQRLCQVLFKERGGRRTTTESIKGILESRGQVQRWVAPPLEPLNNLELQNLVEQVSTLEPDIEIMLQNHSASILV